jgi:hypothetical protein
MSLIKLPVSIGEAIDKLSILDIKCQMIKDSRRDDCLKEFDLLFDELKDFLLKNFYYYNILKYINLKIWKDQDVIRALTDDNQIGKLSTKVLKDNDARFRIKKIINDLSNSELKEQKGYNKTTAVFICHMGMGDMINMNGSIRYVSIMYDEVILFTPKEYEANIKQMFSDLKNIKYLIADRQLLYIGVTKDNIERITGSKINSLYKCGYQIDRSKDMSRIPFSFYEDMDIDVEIMDKFFRIEVPEESKKLCNMLIENEYEFVFCQLMGSTGTANTFDFNKIGIDMDKYLIIDTQINRYPIEHKFHDIAELFIGLPIFQYYDIMKHAKEIHVVNSAFFCLAGRICANDSVESQKKVCYCPTDLTYLNEYFKGWTYIKP